MTLARFDDWPRRLEAAVDQARGKTFAWGGFDCCLFAADCVAAMTGTDFAAPFRGRYRSRRGAFALLKREFGGGVDKVAAAQLGDALKTPLLAGRGDVVLLDSVNGPGLGMCLGTVCAQPNHQVGLDLVPLNAAHQAWRV